MGYQKNANRLALVYILDAVRTGREPIVPGSETLKSMAIVLAIEKTASTDGEAIVQNQS